MLAGILGATMTYPQCFALAGCIWLFIISLAKADS